MRKVKKHKQLNRTHMIDNNVNFVMCEQLQSVKEVISNKK